MSKVLITGSSGFIGGYVVSELLKAGHEVVGVDNLSKYGKVIRNLLPLEPSHLELLATLDYLYRQLTAGGGGGPWKARVVERFKSYGQAGVGKMPPAATG